MSLTASRAVRGASASFVKIPSADGTLSSNNDISRITKLTIKVHKCYKNILAPSFITLLKPDIGDAKYSLLLDESTDISVCKTLGVVINYFSLTRSTFLSIVPLEEGDAKTIANSLCQELSNFKLNLENLIGIGTDNASVKGVQEMNYQNSLAAVSNGC
ncbi:uncharacterized protein LOC122320567 [Drosophila ficusphila]|uniref:uncharacterized protein LOC122320567 n=1 Tax=Drosophila ficusphila TaxID=30025 RepID=UPI001C8A6696|nr:uncharacterized protein LOC122320567 [Drosophila ficusphila]